ncbi:MAG: hypothetical protein ACLP59_10695 [Bryobacteraceae bacterium]
MKRLLPWLLFWFPLVIWAQAQIEINCPSKQHCVADPSYLALGTLKQVVIKSTGEWVCFVYDPSGKAKAATAGLPCVPQEWKKPDTAQQPALIFCPKGHTPDDQDPTNVVVPLLIEQAPAMGVSLPLVAAALLSALSAAMSLFLWAGAGAPSETLRAAQERLRGDLQLLPSTIDRVAANLQFPELPLRREPERGRDREPDRSPSSEDTRRTLTAEPQGIGLDRAQLMGSIDAWTKLAPTIPPEIGIQTTRLLSAGRNISAAELRTIAETIAQVAVRSTDEMAGAGGEYPKFEDALRTLVRSAGLTLIEPQTKDAFDDNRHRTMGSSSDTPSPQLRGSIAKVKRRGLERSGTVVAKAEVILYD